jgi:hypothetical protein
LLGRVFHIERDGVAAADAHIGESGRAPRGELMDIAVRPLLDAVHEERPVGKALRLCLQHADHRLWLL